MTDSEADKGRARAAVDTAAGDLVELSHRIHAHPELAMQEVQAHAWLTDALERHGFDVTRGAYDLPTAFVATAGDTGPHFVVCAEYDALPGVGHACGHNIIATAALGCGIGLLPLAGDLGFRVSVLGTPAEEAIGGKAILVERGALDGVDAALMVHPAPIDIREAPFLTVSDFAIAVHGEAAHASLTGATVPGQGGETWGRRGNALDALVSIYQHLARREYGPYERCHGVITNGGAAANVVPERTDAAYAIRARTLEDLEALRGAIGAEVVEAAAANGCTVTLETYGLHVREVKHNRPLARLYETSARALGREFLAQEHVTPAMGGSTDMGNVSQVVPAIHPALGIESLPAFNHMRGFADAAAAPTGDRAILDGALAMAWTILDVVTGDGVLDEMRADFAATDTTGAPIQ